MTGLRDQRDDHPAPTWTGSPGSGSAGLPDSTGVVRCHDRSSDRCRLVAHGAKTKDERDQGEHLSLKIWIAAVQQMAGKWLRAAIAANATGSIVIAQSGTTRAAGDRNAKPQSNMNMGHRA